jgi:hypothetical protein
LTTHSSSPAYKLEIQHIYSSVEKVSCYFSAIFEWQEVKGNWCPNEERRRKNGVKIERKSGGKLRGNASDKYGKK